MADTPELQLWRSCRQEDGAVVEIRLAPMRGYYWYRLLSPQGHEVATGMYTVTANKAEEDGTNEWRARRSEFDQEEQEEGVQESAPGGSVEDARPA